MEIMSNLWLKQALEKKKASQGKKEGSQSDSVGKVKANNQVTSNRPSKKAAGRGR